MIIIRQKTFARHHYAGLNAVQGVVVKLKRNAQAVGTKMKQRSANRELNRDIARSNRQASRGAGLLSMFGGKFNDVEKDALATGLLNRNQERVNDAFERRNARYQSILDKSKGDSIAEKGLRKSIKRSGLPQEYGVNTITNTYKKPIQQPTNPATAGGGMGFGKKLAIGAAAVGATALAAKAIKNRLNQRKEEEEQQQYQQQ